MTRSVGKNLLYLGIELVTFKCFETVVAVGSNMTKNSCFYYHLFTLGLLPSYSLSLILIFTEKSPSLLCQLSVTSECHSILYSYVRLFLPKNNLLTVY